MKNLTPVWLRRIAAIAAGIVLGVAVAVFAAQRAFSPLAPHAAPVDFVLAPGSSLAAAARELEERRLIRSARAFRWYAHWTGVDARLQAGEYELSPAMSVREIVQRLTAGKVKSYSIALPEGLTATEIAARLATQDLTEINSFLAAVRDAELARTLGFEGETLEGYLFPETYQLQKGLSPHDLIEILVGEFRKAWEQVAPAAAAAGLSQRQAVILASLIEKETGIAEERALISSVFHNRLRRGMRLETDPSVIYGITDFDGDLRRTHLEDERNLYNTYRIAGLPPGPIGNPGLASLRAAVLPAATEYFYFVSRNDGTHVFSKTYREHVNAVNRYQK